MINLNKAKVAVIGSGLIGRAWAIVFARAGVEVKIFDQSKEALNECLSHIKALLEDKEKFGLLSEEVSEILARIYPVETLEEACAGVVLVQENIKETVEAKLEIFAKLDRLTPEDAILASSTSWLPTSLFTEKLNGCPSNQSALLNSTC